MDSFLPYFINEPVYLVKEESADQKVQEIAHKTKEPAQEVNHTANTIPQEKPFVPYVFFASVATKEEQALLSKIMGACGLPENQLSIRPPEDLDQVVFKKAVAFSEKGSNYYVISPYGKGSILYSKPLSVLLNSVDDKRALWGKLKGYFNESG